MDSSLSTLITTAWILAIGVVSVIFVFQFLPVAIYITRGIPVVSLIWVLPVILFFAFMFFGMGTLMLGAGMVMGFFLVWGAAGLICQKFISPKSTQEKRYLWNAVWDSTVATYFLMPPAVWVLLIKMHLISH